MHVYKQWDAGNLYIIYNTSLRKFCENVLRPLFCLVLFVVTDDARVTHVKLTFPSGERDYIRRVPTFIILCAHTRACLYIIYTICMAFMSDEIQFNIILTVVFFSIVYLFILFPLSLVLYRPAVDNAHAVKRITTERPNGKSLEFCCELRRRRRRRNKEG